jgi:hypothetical protein
MCVYCKNDIFIAIIGVEKRLPTSTMNFKTIMSTYFSNCSTTATTAFTAIITIISITCSYKSQMLNVAPAETYICYYAFEF